MFLNNIKYKWEALVENKGNNWWYKYYIDNNWKIVVDIWNWSIYYPMWNIFVKIDCKVRKVNNKWELISELDEFNLTNILKP